MTSDSARRHRQAQAQMERIAAQVAVRAAAGEAQDAQDAQGDNLTDQERRIRARAAQHAQGAPQGDQGERHLGRSFWEGPEKTPAQVERDKRRADDARVAADMRSDACTWITDSATGRRRPVRDWTEV